MSGHTCDTETTMKPAQIRLTENQLMFLKRAGKVSGQWYDIDNSCLNGNMNGKGRGTVIRSLEKRRLIESRFRKVAEIALVYHECIRITAEGRNVLRAVICKRCEKRAVEPVTIGRCVFCMLCTCHECADELEKTDETICRKCARKRDDEDSEQNTRATDRRSM